MDISNITNLPVDTSSLTCCKPCQVTHMHPAGGLEQPPCQAYSVILYAMFLLRRPCTFRVTSCRVVQMFARELTPGWTSWGNQVLQFQQMHHFQPA